MGRSPADEPRSASPPVSFSPPSLARRSPSRPAASRLPRRPLVVPFYSHRDMAGLHGAALVAAAALLVTNVEFATAQLDFSPRVRAPAHPARNSMHRLSGTASAVLISSQPAAPAAPHALFRLAPPWPLSASDSPGHTAVNDSSPPPLLYSTGMRFSERRVAHHPHRDLRGEFIPQASSRRSSNHAAPGEPPLAPDQSLTNSRAPFLFCVVCRPRSRRASRLTLGRLSTATP